MFNSPSSSHGRISHVTFVTPSTYLSVFLQTLPTSPLGPRHVGAQLLRRVLYVGPVRARTVQCRCQTPVLLRAARHQHPFVFLGVDFSCFNSRTADHFGLLLQSGSSQQCCSLSSSNAENVATCPSGLMWKQDEPYRSNWPTARRHTSPMEQHTRRRVIRLVFRCPQHKKVFGHFKRPSIVQRAQWAHQCTDCHGTTLAIE